MTAENYRELLNQAEQAFANNDPYQGMTFVRQILNEDFTNDPAWQLLYRMVKPKQPFEVFQMELAKKIFPDQVHLLMEKELANLLQGFTPAPLEGPPSKPPVEWTEPVPVERTPRQAAPVSHILDIRFCPQCGQERSADIRFCIQCGFDFSAGIHTKAERARQADEENLHRQVTRQEPAPDLRVNPLTSQLIANPSPNRPAPAAVAPPVDSALRTNRVSPPAAGGNPLPPQVNRNALVRSLTSTDFNEVLYAINQIRENKLTDLAPYLLEAADVPRRFRQQDLKTQYISAMTAALCAVFTPDMAKDLRKLVWRNRYWPSQIEFSRTLAAHGLFKEALAMLESSTDPACNGLLMELAYGDIPSEDAVEGLCKLIAGAKKIYEPGISGGYLVSFFDPISFLVTAALSVAYTVASNVAQRAAWDQAGQLNAMLMVAPNQLSEEVLKELPRPVILILSYHTYATALAKIARSRPHLILNAVQNHNKGIQQAVLGMAMAQNRMEQAYSILNSVVNDNHWAVRIVAYEGLSLLFEQFNRPPDMLIISALQDDDPRVVLSVASAMIATGRPEYETPILALAQDPDAKRRVAFLSAIALLAGYGSTAARHVLKNAAQNDKSERVREQAVEHLRNLG